MCSKQRERKSRPNGSNEERSPAQLGVMDVVRRRRGGFDQTVELLVKRGLLSKFQITEGYFRWQTICRDEEVAARSRALALKNRPQEIPSVAAPHKYGLQVIRSMSVAEIKSLARRIGAA